MTNSPQVLDQSVASFDIEKADEAMLLEAAEFLKQQRNDGQEWAVAELAKIEAELARRVALAMGV